MARKAIKQEHLSLMHEASNDPLDPRSSGDTIVIDSDSTMTDEGYETNHKAQKPGKYSGPAYNKLLNMLILVSLGRGHRD